MELPVEPSHGRNLERPPWCYLLWGVPAVLAIGAASAYAESALSITATGIFYSLSVAWAGIGCFINARSCGRVHCRIDGVLFPLLSIAGLLNVFSIISFSWSLFWLVFLLILILSFVPEWTWKKYS